jgi:ribosomal protein L11 methyltransferase
MIAEGYWSLSIEVPRRRVEALTSWLLERGFASFEERTTPRGIAMIVYAVGPSSLERLRDDLLRVAAGVGVGELGFRLAEVPADWAVAWTQHLEPVVLTPTLTACPYRPAGVPAAGELYLEPAFAFGFGEHESTRLAARWLEAACRRTPGGRVLDVGCGTGVLALVAQRNGAASVLGIDLSDPAIVAARRNADLNGIDRGVAFERRRVDEVSGRFEHVVANIEASVLCELAGAICQRLETGGALGLTGFISEQIDSVARRYASEGLRLGLRDREGDWCLLVGEKERQDADEPDEGKI